MHSASSAAAPLVAGNRVALLVDGPQTLGAIRGAIEKAQHHVHLETYIFADDEIGRALRELLISRRQQGIEVRVLYDAIGSVTTPAAFFEPMRQAGVEVLPVSSAQSRRARCRGRSTTATIARSSSSTAASRSPAASTSAARTPARRRSRPGPEAGREEAWRDTHVQIEGPVAAQFQALFLRDLDSARGGDVDGGSAQYFPPLAPIGAELVAAVATSGGDRNETTIYATYCRRDRPRLAAPVDDAGLLRARTRNCAAR